MNNYICNYSLLRFRPYAETGEFAVVGVLVELPQLGTLTYRLLDKNKYGRITQFFPEISQEIVKDHLNIMASNLEFYIRDEKVDFFEATDSGAVFTELTRQREGLITFGEIGTMLIKEPLNAANHIFRLYVERNFVHNSGTILSRSINQFLKEWEIDYRFKKKQRIACLRDTTVELPYAEITNNGKIITGMFPLSLKKFNINGVEKRLDNIHGNFRRLSKAGKTPEKVILPYNLNNEDKVKQHTLDSLEEIRETYHATPVNINNKEELRSIIFA